MISVLNVISSTHNSCEDSFFIQENEIFIWGGVFDGCSTGIKSHWASQTFAYVFNRIECENITSNMAVLLAYHELRAIKNTLDLIDLNFLSTSILFRYNKSTEKLEVRIFGDGFYYVNDVEYEIEQNNTPDYLGYHLDGGFMKFMAFINKYPVISYDNVTSFRICSDGIKSIGISQFVDNDGTDPMSLLFGRPTSENYLKRMWNILKRKHFSNSDDLTIISYVQD